MNKVQPIIFLGKALLFWLLFFFIQRIFFIGYNFRLFQTYSALELVKSMLVGVRLDVATSCYLLLFPFTILCFSIFVNSGWIKKLHHLFAFVLILVLLFVTLGNTLLYKEWQSLLSKRALSFLLYPKEVFASLSFAYVGVAFLVAALLQFSFYRMWLKFVVLPNQINSLSRIHKLLYLALTPAFLILGARGGFQLIPINESAVYFSSHTAVNHAAVNPIWYLGSSIWNPVDDENKYYFMKGEDADKLTASLFENGTDSTSSILKSNRPNIVLLVLESFTADLLGTLDGEKDICPNLDSLSKQGILFTHIYGSGSRTDQGLVSILSAFPPQPDKSIIKYTAKAAKLPSLYKELSAAGYSSSFYYGGEVEFANIGAYLRQSGVEKIINKSDFTSSQINSKWGAHDEFVLARQLNELNSSAQPFFSVLLTLSNHEPFETPGIPKYKGDDEASKFRNTAAYTDRCLGNYFREVAKTKWYSNTLFILVADHGHRLPQENDLNMPKSKHIPLLFLGGALKDSLLGIQISKLGNQQDILATLLHQLQLPGEKNEWSKNLLNKKAQDFAYYCNENVLGWITSTDTCVYSFIEKKNIASSKQNKEDIQKSQAYLQKLYNQFLRY